MKYHSIYFYMDCFFIKELDHFSQREMREIHVSGTQRYIAMSFAQDIFFFLLKTSVTEKFLLLLSNEYLFSSESEG